MSVRMADGAIQLGIDFNVRSVRTGYLRSGTALGLLMIATAQASAGGFGSGAKRIRAGHIVCGYAAGWACIDVLESGNDDLGAGHRERDICHRHSSILEQHA